MTRVIPPSVDWTRPARSLCNTCCLPTSSN
ncbi:MAG: hypothetical protein H6821_05170 [Planctomycetaceae bacterium]|nr:hypothetical protein [Planctomycetales bacterium]MCB9873552.1 hypothetical protein [Planctomycetaceae bacterium]MCB9937102.1 hypothetical protein [Planctomycetaceae bacterium]